MKKDYLLIVEDDPDILKLLDTALEIRGYRVVKAHNGWDGLKAIQSERPSIVITDIMMPKMDGFGLVHRLRINPETRDIPVVIITATYVTLEDKEFAMNIGATRFIQKPIDMVRFLKTIDEVIQHRTPNPFEPLKEFNFYDGYRKRLEAKLEQKNKQIARDEYLLGIHADDLDMTTRVQASFEQASSERDELKLLLDQIYQQLERYKKME